MSGEVEFDDVLAEVGAWGWYQKILLLLVFLPSGNLPCAFGGYSQAFMAYTPKHWCHVRTDLNISQEDLKKLAIPKTGAGEYESCRMYSNWSSLNSSTESVVPCTDGWNYDLPEGMTSVVSEWDLVCERNFLPTLALVLFFASGLIGHFLVGYALDRSGRHTSYFLFLLVSCTFGISTSFAPSLLVWIFMRVAVGFTIPAISFPTYFLALELVGPDQKNICNLLENFGYSLGMLLLSGVVWISKDWRHMSIYTSLPFIAFFSLWWFLPESPRWLLAKRRYDDLENNLKNIAKYNKKPFPTEMFQRLKNTNEKAMDKMKEDKVYGVLDLLRHRVLQRITVVICLIGFVNTAVYVGLTYYAPALSGDEHFNFFLACVSELPTFPVIWLLMDRLGGRMIICASMIVGGVSCSATFFANGDPTVTLILFCIGKFGISAAFVMVPLIISEMYPTVVRGIGMGVYGFFSMMGPVIIPLVNHLGGDLLILPLIIMGIAQIVGGLSACLLPETMGCRLPQTLEDLEEFECLSCYKKKSAGYSATRNEEP